MAPIKVLLTGEKEQALDELDEWIGEDDNIGTVISGFEEMSLDITSLLEEEGLY